MVWLKRLGYFYNIAKGSESISNQMSHLIVGVLSGLPPFAISLRVGIAFYLGAILELPTGVFADLLGHRRTLVYGYITCAFASLCLFLSCHYSQTSLSLSFLVGSSTLSAVGGGLVSGCLQAFMQDYVDFHVSKSGLTGQDAQELRAKALARSQAYGNFFSGFLPTLVLAGVLASYYMTRRSEWSLLVPVVVYGALATLFCVIRVGKEKPTKAKSFLAHSRDYGRQLMLFKTALGQRPRTGQFRFMLLFVRMLLSILTVIHVHTYLMVSQLRQIGLQQGSLNAMIMGFLILAAFDLAHYPKGWIVPFVSKRLSANRLLYFSLISQSMLGLIALVCFRLDHTVSAVIGFALLFNSVFSPGHMTLQSQFLTEIPENLRASVFSIVQIVVLLVYGSYSALLTASGVGVDRPDRIFTELVTLASLGFVLAVMSDCLSVTRANGAVLDDVQA